MKQFIVFLAAVTLAATVQAQSTVNIKFKGLKDQRVACRTVEVNRMHDAFATIDTLLLTKGRLVWTPKFDQLTRVEIIPVEKSFAVWDEIYIAQNSAVTLLIAPDDEVDMTVGFDKHDNALCKFKKGSQLNRDINCPQIRCDEDSKEMTDIFRAMFAPDFDGERNQEYDLRQRAIQFAIQYHYIQYVRSHPKDEVSIWLLYNITTRPVEPFMAPLQQTAQTSVLKTAYKTMANAIETAKLQKANIGKAEEGVEAPDFTLKDAEGNDFSLCSLRGKWVIVDFWGSWCSWCIKGFPSLKKYYADHSERVEVVGVACNDSDEKWHKALEENDLQWKNVINDDRPEGNVAARYNITAFPTKLLISPEGVIVVRYEGEDDEFYGRIGKYVELQ